MNIQLALSAAAGVLLLGAAAASAADQPPQPAGKATAPRECFWTRQADSFAAQDDRTVNVRVSVRDVYQFKLLGSCPDIDWNQRIALVSRSGSNICSGLDAEIISHSPIGPQHCAVTDMRKLTLAEIAALPRRARP